MSICRIEEAIWHLLTSNATVSARASGGVHHDVLPQEADDAGLVIAAEAIEPYQHLSGPAGMAKSTLVVHALARTRSQAQVIAEAARVALAGWHGLVTLADTRSLFVQGISIGPLRAAHYQAEDQRDEGRSGVRFSLVCTHQLPVAVQP
jgi:hypothetical protein